MYDVISMFCLEVTSCYPQQFFNFFPQAARVLVGNTCWGQEICPQWAYGSPTNNLRTQLLHSSALLQHTDRGDINLSVCDLFMIFRIPAKTETVELKL